MKLVFFGTGTFAVPVLETLAENVALVVSQPDSITGRGLDLKPSPVKLAALRLGLLVETPDRSRSPEFVARLGSFEADALVVASYGQILSPAVLDSAIRGGINLHGSILPKLRGAAPIQRALLNGETETGVTLMQMDKGTDTGGIIDVQKAVIGPHETYGELQERLALIAASLASQWVPRIVAGEYSATPQDNGTATLAPKVEKSEAMMSFDRTAIEEYARFRAFTPRPSVDLETSVGKVKLLDARPADQSGEPGVVVAVKPSLLLAFKSGSIEILSAQLQGKRAVSGSDLANGLRLKPGMNLRPQ